MRTFFIFVFVLLLISSQCIAQQDADAGALAFGAFGSAGQTGSGGVFIGVYDTGSARKLVNPGIFLNLGVAGPTNKTSVDGLFSFDFQSTYNLFKGGYKQDRRNKFFF